MIGSRCIKKPAVGVCRAVIARLIFDRAFCYGSVCRVCYAGSVACSITVQMENLSFPPQTSQFLRFPAPSFSWFWLAPCIEAVMWAHRITSQMDDVGPDFPTPKSWEKPCKISEFPHKKGTSVETSSYADLEVTTQL
ncbi:hypothetical protein F0562_001109 [Nyssa sinensis]|uniref:Uncharacterized protein n=1 Tax=Nyssa sinensis TaxID=561372 RepID=A0A5J5C2A1_9ASTE|nr:hypothetical protein F0562_001109 [Nyssa sinensis]